MVQQLAASVPITNAQLAAKPSARRWPIDYLSFVDNQN